MSKCKICLSNSERLFQKTILKKYTTTYHRCLVCGFVQTDEPIWLADAYADAISDMDTGIFVRNIKMSKIVPLIISTYFDKSKSFLDFGAGYGIFVRMMRDKGFNFFWQDEYCQNIFTKNYGINNNLNGRFELVTAFEVFEHLVNPSLELEKMLKFSDSILFSTNIVPDKDLENWWYLSPETGQHIALYSLKSLQKLGELHQLNFYTNGHNFHLFTKKSINPLIFQILKTIKQLSQFIRPTSAKNAFQIDRENLK